MCDAGGDGRKWGGWCQDPQPRPMRTTYLLRPHHPRTIKFNFGPPKRSLGRNTTNRRTMVLDTNSVSSKWPDLWIGTSITKVLFSDGPKGFLWGVARNLPSGKYLDPDSCETTVLPNAGPGVWQESEETLRNTLRDGRTAVGPVSTLSGGRITRGEAMSFFVERSLSRREPCTSVHFPSLRIFKTTRSTDDGKSRWRRISDVGSPQWPFFAPSTSLWARRQNILNSRVSRYKRRERTQGTTTEDLPCLPRPWSWF